MSTGWNGESAMIVSEFPYSQIPVAQSLCLLYLLRSLFDLLVDQALSGLKHKTCRRTPSHILSALCFCDVFKVNLFTVEHFYRIISSCNSLQTNSEFSVFSIFLIASDLRKTLVRRIFSRARRLQKIMVDDFFISCN